MFKILDHPIFFDKLFHEHHQGVKQFGLIWVQTDCKGYQQMTKGAPSWQKVCLVHSK